MSSSTCGESRIVAGAPSGGAAAAVAVMDTGDHAENDADAVAVGEMW